MADNPVLVCISGARKGEVFPIPDGGLSIGRAEDNDIPVVEEGVSRYHVRLLYENGTLWLQDAGSRNGVFVDDQRVTGHKALKVGHKIKIAEHVFELKWESDVTPPAGAPVEPGTTGKKKSWFWPFS